MTFLAFIPVLNSLLDRVLPDPKIAADAKLEVLKLSAGAESAQLDAQVKEALAAAGIIQQEAASTHWLAANWRPILMLTFAALIVARFLGYTAQGISEAEYAELWGIIKVGIGGYTIGRTVEKIAPSVVTALKK